MKKVLLKTAKLGKYQNGMKAIIIKFPFDVDIVKSMHRIPGAKFNRKNKYWHCPFSKYAVKILKKLKFRITPELYKQKEQVPKPIQIPGLKGKLRRYQKQGVKHIDIFKNGAIIGDEMGLGKTLQALGYLQLYPNKRPVVIVCTSSNKIYWMRMCYQWLNSCSVQIINSRSDEINQENDIFIVNYELLPPLNRSNKILAGVESKLLKLNTKILIVDELQMVKNPTSKQAKAVEKLRYHSEKAIGLTGTLIDNSPLDAWNQIRIINPNIFPNYYAYAHRYCDPKKGKYGWDFSGSSNEDELHAILKTQIMIRRLKKNVEKEIPDKDYSFIPLEISNRTEYNEAKNNFSKYVIDNIEKELTKKLIKFGEDHGIEEYDFSTHVLNKEKFKKIVVRKFKNKNTLKHKFEKLRQIAAKGKLKSAIEWIEEFLLSGEKLVVFTTHVEPLNALYEHFNKIAVKIDGSVHGTKRQEAIDLFQNNKKIKLLFGNIKAAGTSITLTAASNVAFFELPWTPGKLAQAIDRCHRIGQKYKVMVYYLLALNTVEEKIASILDKKVRSQSKIMDGSDIPSMPLLINMIEDFLFKNE